ncbi:MAG: hypothetical protein DPW21_00520 [Anaerolineae bacterium]|nr:hypothetical protein [Chloroflexi bacterium CFX2]MCQ3945166.1 hypothetical protein [Anaerolineae bacterium]MCZ7550941.1 hypothetical protein [Anaerolineales bacterium]HPO85005.1 hypothetical protein [Candidatus Hydrogenedentota bacterium]
MYDYMLEEMAEAIAKECNVDNNDVLRVLGQYWQDKIAHVWQVEDVLEAAHRAEKPITREDALTILQQVFHGLDSELGITWLTVDVALEEYSLDFKTLTPETYSHVAGVFEVWRKYDAVSVQFGLFPNQMDGNLVEALEFAKHLARQVPGVPIHLGCERYASEETEPWLTILLKDGNAEPTIEESEATCKPSSPDNASAS